MTQLPRCDGLFAAWKVNASPTQLFPRSRRAGNVKNNRA